MVLMCKDAPVYEIESKQILNEDLMPGAMLKGMSYESWVQHRKSVISNVIARRAYFNAFGYEAEDKAERKTHILSLSDCYWRKYENESVTFGQISPYCTDFWDGTGPYLGGAVPTIYTSGVKSKYWLDSNRLFKEGCAVELEAYSLADTLNIPCNKIEASPDNRGIIVHNFTSSDVMLEPAICSGRFKGTFFATIDEVFSSFGEPGLVMLAFDAVIGNTDRHLENFGFLRDANMGAYIGMAPLFDFDHTLSSDSVDDYLIEQLPKHSVIDSICNQVLRQSSHPIFRARAQAIIKKQGDGSSTAAEKHPSLSS